MEDLSAMIGNLLQSPDGMEKIKAMADSLLSGQSSPPAAPAPPAPPPAPVLPELSAGEIAGLMKMANLLRAGGNDSRSSLLLSLRPHLSTHRQKRVDEAVKILRLIQILPAVTEAGIL